MPHSHSWRVRKMVADLGPDHPDVKLSQAFGAPERPNADWFSEHWYIGRAPDRDQYAWSHPSGWWITDNEDGTYSLLLREYDRGAQEYVNREFHTGSAEDVLRHAKVITVRGMIPNTESRSYANAAPMNVIDALIRDSLNEKKLTGKERQALPKDDFVFPGKRKYPIPDKAHARNALARVSQHGTPAQQAKVKGAVKKKFPAIGKDKAQESIITNLETLHLMLDESDRRVLEGALAAVAPEATTIAEAQALLPLPERRKLVERFSKRLALRDLAPFLPKQNTITEVGDVRRLLADDPA